MEDLNALRIEIDTIDQKIVQDFLQRMNVVRKIGKIKKSAQLPIQNTAREQQLLLNIVKNVPKEMTEPIRELFQKIMEISRNYQENL